jgi:hypothetical protein
MEEIKEKICPCCGIPKPTSEFYKNKSAKDGLSSYCKPCQNKAQNTYQEKKQEQSGKVIDKTPIAEMLKKVAEVIEQKSCSILIACEELGFNYDRFIRNIDKKTKIELRALKLPKLVRPGVTVESLPVVEGMAFPFPPVVYKVVNGSYDKGFQKLRFYMRSQLDQYWAAGYEYEQNPNQYQSDQHLYEFHKDPQTCLDKLRETLAEKLAKETKDENLGAIRYVLTPESKPVPFAELIVPVVERKASDVIKSVDPVNVDNGEYTGLINGKIGKLTDNEGLDYHFKIDKTLPLTKGVTISVIDKYAYITL